MTERTADALAILEARGPMRPREFARAFWPDSPGWRRSCKCGANGSHRGGGMYLAGGGYLGKLAVAKLASYCGSDGYALSALGRATLARYRAGVKP